jgi:hypothetical protein
MFFCRWVNDETCLNVKSSRILEKGTFECGNVGFSVSLTELNIVNHHSNYYTSINVLKNLEKELTKVFIRVILISSM